MREASPWYLMVGVDDTSAGSRHNAAEGHFSHFLKHKAPETFSQGSYFWLLGNLASRVREATGHRPLTLVPASADPRGPGPSSRDRGQSQASSALSSPLGRGKQ